MHLRQKYFADIYSCRVAFVIGRVMSARAVNGRSDADAGVRYHAATISRSFVTWFIINEQSIKLFTTCTVLFIALANRIIPMWNFHLLCALPNKARVSVSKMLSFINAGPYRACDARGGKQCRVIYRRDNRCGLLISRVSFFLSSYLSGFTSFLLRPPTYLSYFSTSAFSFG